jgi:hypothetical protein
VTTPHRRRAQMPSRSLPLTARARRSRFRGALSTTASLLLPGAFGLVPPLHDDRPRIAVPLSTAPNASSKIGGRRWAGIPFKCPAHDFRRLSLTQNTVFAPKLRRARSILPSRRPMQPRPNPRRRLILAHLEPLGTILRRRRRPLSMRPRTIGGTFRRRDRSVNMARSRQAAPNATIPEAPEP